MLDIRDMSEKDKVFCFVEGLKSWAKTKFQDLTSAYAAAERLFALTSDSQDVMRHQSSSPGRNRDSRSISPKDAGEGNVSVETTGLTNETQRTHDEGRIIEAHPSTLSVVSYVRGHIWQENAQIKLTSMHFRPL
ncbi:reverse transcriptase [Cucumis melo var. makuwa]|uniref:Reverse transcriptase n=1 Tax=Cucumis melo var. makuwa TaxID=1194695 RepID=A0A5A7UHI6_CUCMM|nr:reverse transcriptase [Cucumis melo var. makuwa]